MSDCNKGKHSVYLHFGFDLHTFVFLIIYLFIYSQYDFYIHIINVFNARSGALRNEKLMAPPV